MFSSDQNRNKRRIKEFLSLLQNFLSITFGYFYSIFLNIILVFIKFFAPAKIIHQLSDRNFFADELKKLAHTCNNFDQKVVFYCSSAGEVEQAIPLITALKKRGFTSIIFIFSKSGTHFLKSKLGKENYDFIYFLSPLDFPKVWANIFSAIQPQFTIIVRHEIWPGFLWVAKQWGEVYLVNATDRQFSGLINRFFLKHFSKIFTVEQRPSKALRVFYAGDTKYERAAQRASDELKNPTFPKLFKTVGVFGSVYGEDLRVIASTLQKRLGEGWGFLIFPHELDPSSLLFWKDFFDENSIAFERFSNLNTSTPLKSRVILVDKQGLLAEAYATATFAYVGGAHHARVHNVLEPLVYKIPVFFGPRFHSSPEAVSIVNEKVGFSVQSAEQFQEILKETIFNAGLKNNIDQFLTKRCIASEIILENIKI